MVNSYVIIIFYLDLSGYVSNKTFEQRNSEILREVGKAQTLADSNKVEIDELKRKIDMKVDSDIFDSEINNIKQLISQIGSKSGGAPIVMPSGP